MSSNKLPSGPVGAVLLFLIGAVVGGVGHGIGEHSTKQLFDHAAGTADPVQGRGNHYVHGLLHVL
jgi:hypothetical protein